MVECRVDLLKFFPRPFIFFAIMFSLYFLAFHLVSVSFCFARSDTFYANTTFFESYWDDGTANVSYRSGAEGHYNVTWNGGGNFVGGKGWNPGKLSQLVNFTGTFQPKGYSYLAVYGWTVNPLIEYYIVESYHPEHEPAAPPEGEPKGNLTSDGSLYLVRTKMRVNKPSINGTATFRQIFSVRQEKRSSGIVMVKNHFDMWNAVGLQTGAMNYMILAVEGLNSSGFAEMTVY